MTRPLYLWRRLVRRVGVALVLRLWRVAPAHLRAWAFLEDGARDDIPLRWAPWRHRN